jgi:SulP family sulfate permease
MDLAGAFGDIGVLFPIAVALITLNHLNPTAVFLTAGVAYIAAGWYFQIPMAVQPLKAVAAIALALNLPPTAIASAGLLMGLVLALIAVTNSATWLARLFTLPIVRGIQLGLGLLLAREGVRLVVKGGTTIAPLGGRAVGGWLIATIAAALLLACMRSRRFPAALVLLAAGIGFGMMAQWGNMPALVWAPLPIALLHPSWAELWQVLPLLVLPQLPLTFGNSIVATEDTARLLYREQSKRVTVRGLSFSIALLNLFSGMIQAAPICHGSGGVTAHYRFGARTPRASYIIGAVCLLLALFGGAAVGLVRVIPVAVLGVFLVYVGVQHAAYLRDLFSERLRLAIAVAVGVVSALTTNLMWGFLVGFACEATIFLVSRLRHARLRQHATL